MPNGCGFRPAAEPPPDPILQLPEASGVLECQLWPTVKSDGRPICMNSTGDELPKVGAVDHLASNSPPTQHSSLIRHTPSYGNRFPIRAFASDARWAFMFMCLWARDALTKFFTELQSLEFLTASSWCGGIV